MTEDQLEAQSRAAIKAWCDDPSVQLECKDKFYHGSEWMQNTDLIFNPRQYYYRIAKPRKWYRVGKMQDVLDTETYTLQATSEEDEEHLESDRAFIEWLDERKYYE